MKKILNNSEPTLQTITDQLVILHNLTQDNTKDIKIMQQDVADLKTDMGRVNSHLHCIDDRFERLEVMVSSLDTRTKEDTDALTFEVVKIKERLRI